MLSTVGALTLCFASLQTSLPAGWSSMDVGSPSASGGASFAGGTWSVSGGGSDIWNTSDEFHFVSRELQGDGTIVARVDSIGNSAPWAKAGLMLRAGTGAAAAYADMVVTPSNGVVFQWRSSAGAQARTASAGGVMPAPVWLKLTRSGDEVAGSFSYDGAAWLQVGETTPLVLGTTARAGLAVSAGDSSGLNTADFSSVSLVPAGWEDAEIGAPPVKGSALVDGAAVEISGSGEVFGSADAFHLSSQTFVGDVDVVARIADLVGGGTYAKAGVMIRESVAPDARYAFSFVTPDDSVPGQGANFETRSARGAPTASAASTPGRSAPTWLRLVRRGDHFTAYHSTDGMEWTQNGPAVAVPMGATARVGLAVSGGGPHLATARFTGVRITPLGWVASDVGSPGQAGASTFDGLDWRVSGGGADVWGTSDQFQFARRHWTGDVTLVARVKSLSNTGDFAKAGLMIRDGTAANASYAFAFLNPNNPQPFAGALMEVRSGAGAASEPVGSALGAAAPDWLKLTREGDRFTAYRAHDGIQWFEFGSATVPMGAEVEIGLAVVANDDAALCDAVFEGVSVGTSYRSPFLKANGIHFRDHGGSGDVVDLRGTNTGGWLLHEQWLDGMDSSGLPDDLSIRDTVEGRFGRALANRILATWEEHWITEVDLDNMRALGLNVLRVPFSYRCLYDSSWSWRGDAFARLDWIVDEAWRRGIYVILDLHGAPGGASPFQSSGQVNGGALWWDPWLQDRSVELWSRIAEHFIGHPGIAAYDLINEPVPPSFAAMWSLYDRMHDAIRLLDGDHVVMMEGGGGTGVGNSYWSVDTLPSPGSQGWFNVAYQSHAYALDGGGAAESAAYWQVTQLGLHGVPLLVGEFNLADRQAFGVQLWDDNDVSWTSWTYKVRHSLGSSWGIYGVTQWPLEANLQSDDAQTILAALETVTTDGHFSLNNELRGIFGTPWLADDAYQTPPGRTLYVDPQTGVLANDAVPNGGQPGIEARAFPVVEPENGSLTLFQDGSLLYTPDAGFVGTDSFRYFVWDNVNDSANRATVTVEIAPLPSPWSSSDLGSPGVQGRVEHDPVDNTWWIHGGGHDISGAFDGGHLIEKPLAGNGGVAARVTSVEGTDPQAKAGVMLRESSSVNSAYAYVHATPTGVAFDVRGATGAWATTLGSVNVAPPVWVRVTRDGSDVTGWWSADGDAWSALGTGRLTAPELVSAALAVTSRDDSALNTSAFRGLLASPARPTGVLAVPGDGRVRLRWQPSEGAAAYRVLRATSSSGPFVEIGTPTSGAFMDTGLQNGTLYHYAVTASNGAGESSRSRTVEARPLWSESDWKQTPSSHIRTAR